MTERRRDLDEILEARRVDSDVDEEIAHHIEMRIRDNRARGMSDTEARAEALARFGSVERVRAETRRVDRARHRRRAWREGVGDLASGVRLAVRGLGRRPLLSLSVVAILALGVGATAAVFTVVDRVVLRPLPYPDAEELIWLESAVPYAGADARWGLSQAGYFAFAGETRTLSKVGAYSTVEITHLGEGPPRQVLLASVTHPLLDVLEAQPAVGRLLLEEDDVPGAPRVAVLSHAFWQREFGGDPDVVGRPLRLGSVTSEIVGVLEEGIGLPREMPDVWATLRLDPAAQAVNYHWVAAIGRLAAGRSAEDAQREVDGITSTFADRFPSAYSERFMRESGFRTLAVPLKAHVLGDVERTLWMLFGSVLLLLLITAANVGNLYLVRAEARRRELAIRAALGANARRLAGLQVTESLVLALAAAAPALALAWAGVRVLVRLAPAGLPRLAEVQLDGLSVVFTLGLTVLAGVVVGSLPVVFRTTDPRDVAEGTKRVLSPVRHRLRQGLVGAQVALALVLLAAAGLMLRSFVGLRSVDPGFQADGVATFTVPLPAGRYGDYADVAAFQRRLLDALSTLPGVLTAGAATGLPLVDTNSDGHCAALFFEDQPPDPERQPPCLPVLQVAPGYFETLAIPVRGSAPTWSDLDDDAGRVVVTEAFARRVWPGEDAIGKGLRGNGWEEPFYRVAGVARDIRADGLDRPPLEAAFFPLMPIEGAPLWMPPRTMRVVVRADATSPVALLPRFRDLVGSLDPEVPVVEPRAYSTAIAQSDAMARASFTLMLLGVAGVMALLLSAVGMYGVLAYLVAQRRSEMGVRLALGALPGQVVRMIVGQSLRLAGIGVAVGLVGAVVFTRSLDSLLFGVSPTDPWTLGGAAALLLAVALLATLTPALRAARIDPKAVLQAE